MIKYVVTDWTDDTPRFLDDDSDSSASLLASPCIAATTSRGPMEEVNRLKEGEELGKKEGANQAENENEARWMMKKKE